MIDTNKILKNSINKEVKLPVRISPDAVDEVSILANQKGESVNEIINRYIRSGIANDRLILTG